MTYKIELDGYRRKKSKIIKCTKIQVKAIGDIDIDIRFWDMSLDNYYHERKTIPAETKLTLEDYNGEYWIYSFFNYRDDIKMSEEISANLPSEFFEVYNE